ncbi:MAG: hypothetical protein HY755_03420 [Nitrospirae bacterium]|nr:hypothetical protein [Nitrospirota bacterium]
MVSISILGIAVVALFQLFSISLRSVKKSEDYTKAIVHARSVMDEAYATSDLSEGTESFDFDDGFKGVRTVILKSEDEKTKLYEITVAVSWPPTGTLELRGSKIYYVSEE